MKINDEKYWREQEGGKKKAFEYAWLDWGHGKNGHKKMQQPLKEGGTDPNTLAIWLNKISPGKSLVVVSKKLQAF